MKLHYLFSGILILIPLKLSIGSAGALTKSEKAGIALSVDPVINLSDIKNIPDLYFECQIAEMSKHSTIPMFYNPLVREYIEIYLTGRKSQVPELCLLSLKYFPIFEENLKTQGLPAELKYIPVIESGLNPQAISPTGAYGLWQFKAETGRSLGLMINDTADERSDPSKSTHAACDYLKYLYGIFGDWQLSLLAYHAGPGTVKSAILKAGGKTSFNDIYGFLPLATQRYLPAYIAVMYVMNNYKNHI